MQRSGIAEKLNGLLSQRLEHGSQDTISDEMREKISDLAKTDEAHGGMTVSKEEALDILAKNLDFLNHAGEYRDKMIERLDQELQGHQEIKEKYQSMLDGDSSLSEFM